jgi:hypothetical protein
MFLTFPFIEQAISLKFRLLSVRVASGASVSNRSIPSQRIAALLTRGAGPRPGPTPAAPDFGLTSQLNCWTFAAGVDNFSLTV